MIEFIAKKRSNYFWQHPFLYADKLFIKLFVFDKDLSLNVRSHLCANYIQPTITKGQSLGMKPTTLWIITFSIK